MEANALLNPTKPPQRRLRFPVPTVGLDSSIPYFADSVESALIYDNMIPKSLGADIRKGWRYWLEAGAFYPGSVHTLMSYIGSDASDNKLFASIDNAGTTEVYDATIPDSPIGSPAFSDGSAVYPGRWSWVNYVNVAGSFLCAVSQGSGYWIYEPSGGWAQINDGAAPGEVDFPDSTVLADIDFIFVWKNRLWFVKADSSVAYYLPVYQITGTTAAFDFGPQLKHGGSIAFGANWTYDGGSGLDDFMVLMGTNGDVIIYQGTDPASASTFGLKGTWFTGRPSVGRRGFAQHGGDLLFITELGIVSVSDLVSGRIISASTGTFGARFNQTIATIISNTLGDNYWYLVPYFVDEVLYVGSPYVNIITNIALDFGINSLNQGWCSFSNMPAFCAVVHEGQFIFGMENGKLAQGFFGFNDEASYDGDDPGSEVVGRGQTFYHDLGDAASNKRVTRIKFNGVSEGAVAIAVKVVQEYDEQLVSVDAVPSTGGGVWDVGLWDAALWAASRASFRRWIGVSGYGKKLSVLWAIRGNGHTIIADYEMDFQMGLGL